MDDWKAVKSLLALNESGYNFDSELTRGQAKQTRSPPAAYRPAELVIRHLKVRRAFLRISGREKSGTTKSRQLQA
jgi:hypothetical protein